MDPRTTRGFLNNNPGNLDRAAGEPWQGEIRDSHDSRLTAFQANELTAGRFAVFASPEWGIRAMAKNLQAYQRSGFKTVRQMIDRWAPPSENNTVAYIQAVAERIGQSADTPIEMTDYKAAAAVIDAIIRVECAGMPYAGKELEDGLRLAGVVKPVGITTSTTAKGATVASTATVGTAALSALQQPIQQTADSLAPFAGTTQTVDHILLGLKLALGAIALIGVGIMVWERIKRERRDQAIDPNPTVVGV